jgi:hypothetical protein
MFAVGGFASFNTNNDYIPKQTYTFKDQSALTTDVDRSIYQVPFGVTMRTRFMRGEFQPYLGTKVGAEFSTQSTYMSTFVNRHDNWGFYMSPEIGFTYFPFQKTDFGFQFAVYYSFCTNKNSDYDIKGIDNLKRSLRYKSQLLGCVALDIKPKSRIEDSKALLEKANALIERSQASNEAKNYIMATTEYDVYMSSIEYPVMYESVRKLPVDSQEIGNYWNIMDGYVTRTDTESLSCPEYASLLIRYCFYMNEKAAMEKGEKYKTPGIMEDMYKEIAAYYDGEQRDFLLYTLLRNFIMNGKEIERADVLYKEYLEKYNTSTFHKSILEMLLQ